MEKAQKKCHVLVLYFAHPFRWLAFNSCFLFLVALIRLALHAWIGEAVSADSTVFTRKIWVEKRKLQQKDT